MEDGYLRMKKALLSSVLTIALCLSLIAGSSFALFTSESAVDVSVSAGNVSVLATADEPVLGSTLGDNVAETRAYLVPHENKVMLEKLVPGDYVTFTITVTNRSDITVKYRTVISQVADDGLWEQLEVTIGGTAFDGTTRTSAWAELAPGAAPAAVAVKVYLPEEADSSCSGKSCTFAYTVEALQGNAEPTVWDGVSADTTWYTAALQAKIATSPTPVDIKISTAAQYAGLVKLSNTQTNFRNAVIYLENDIDLNGHFIDQIGASSSQGFFQGTFDGQNHTITGFRQACNQQTLTYSNPGLFGVLNGATVRNLVIDGADVSDTHYGGIGLLAGCTTSEGAMAGQPVVVENVHIRHSIVRRTTENEEWQGTKIGLFFGNVNGKQDVIIRNCTITDSAVVATVAAVPVCAWYGRNERTDGWAPTIEGSSLNNVVVGTVYGTGHHAAMVRLADILDGTVRLKTE